MALENRYIAEIVDSLADIVANLDDAHNAYADDTFNEHIMRMGATFYCYRPARTTANGVNFLYVDQDFGEVTLHDDLLVDENIIHDGDTDTFLQFTTDKLNISAGGVSMVDFVEDAADYIEFNPNDLDVDFIVNGTLADLFVIDAGLNRIGICTAAPATYFDVSPTIATTGTVATVARIGRLSAGNMADNDGVSQEFAIDDGASATIVTARVDSIWSDVSEKYSQLRFSTYDASNLVEILRLGRQASNNFVEPMVSVHLVDNLSIQFGTYAPPDAQIIHDTTTTPDELRIEVLTAGEHLRLKAAGAASALVLEGAVSFPRATVNLTADDTLVTPGVNSYIYLNSNDSTPANRTFGLAAGNFAGHVIYLEANACELTNTVGGRADVLFPSGSKLTFSISGSTSATLIYNGTCWVLLSYTATLS